MNIIVFARSRSRPLRINFDRPKVWLAMGVGLLFATIPLLGTGFLFGTLLGDGKHALALEEASKASEQVRQQRRQLESLRAKTTQHFNALALHLGQVQARATRLEALGERLTRLGQLDDGEFDFRAEPALGGPVTTADYRAVAQVDIQRELLQLEQRMARQADQLGVLADLIANRELEKGLEPAGRPIGKGWLSSHFGQRSDPFNGQPDFHLGMDFTGVDGSAILAVAGGVVVWSGERPQYGLTVDIDHGNGYLTRYAHNRENLVDVGDRVHAGENIALMGKTGRATAPHVHFEVWLEGRRINPNQVVNAIR